jgi:hypothetical protein
MHLSRKAIMVLLPMFMFGVAARAWSAGSDQAITTNAQIVPATNGSTDLLSMLRPVTNARAQTDEPQIAANHRNCIPSTTSWETLRAA